MGSLPPHSLPPVTSGSSKPGAVTRVSSKTLLGGAGELEILHDGKVYLLRITSTGKLILTR